ncbi:MAG: Arylsulfatase [Planctomycetes bacterium ADurb.Bin126]|nr:MAG: Arylsulfatase [Planctomycetes bacterium ADurb.Bin126]HOD81684.1 arylsulfatase [Phycisphaerae bacterium]HQL75937.1 arylsulfatase [Phycisphaerae bacterium]
MSTGNWTRRDFLKAAGCAAAGALAGRPAPAAGELPRKSPNVILVMTDDQGYGDLHCLGNQEIQTPNLDKLHGQSVRLRDFHVAPTCSPTRAGLMTGRSCNRTGVWHTIMGRSILRRDEVTMAQAFAAGGYRTAIFGKWHLGDNYPSRPQDKGFQEVLVHGGGGVGQTPDYWGNTYSDDTYFRNGKPEKHSGYCTDVWFDNAMKFIESSKDRPFFVYLPTNAPHGPYNVPDKYAQLYRDKGVKGPLANFYGMITNIDENMGRLMARLGELGLEDNTILIFMTDNGTSGSGFNAGMKGRKGSPYEGGHRVPCFVRWPAGGLLQAGTDVDELAANLDLLPTLVELCGLTMPKGPEVEGTSLATLLRGKGKLADRTLVTDSQRMEHPKKWNKSAVMNGKWRLIDGKELYHVGDDPGQTKDLAAKEPERVEKLRAEYEKWWEKTSTQFDEYCPIVLGSERENPSRLTCHDWHEAMPPWNQQMILRGPASNGFWAVEVERAGEYEISLRRWDEVLDLPIIAAGEGKAIKADKARLQIGPFDQTQDLTGDARAAVFKAKLPAGPAKLRTWFLGDNQDRGAYYVYVRRL